MQNDDDADICPVCDGECTCHPATGPNAPPSPSSSHHPPTLKIKLTLPSAMRSLPQTAALSDPPSIQDRPVQPLAPPAPVPETRRRGRPPKAPAQPRVAKPSAASSQGAPTTTKRRGTARNAIATQAPPHQTTRKQTRRTQQPAPARVVAESTSEADDNTDGADAVLFTTFLSTVSSSDEGKESDNESSTSVLDSGDDTSIEAEEERFIVEESRAQEKARKRKEMIPEKDSGSEHGGGPEKRWKYNWESRPRKDSGGSERGSDGKGGAGGGGESDSGEESEEEDSDDDDSDDDGEVEGEAPGSILPGTIATGESWSDSEDEDDFDAALFFAGLSDSSANGSSDEDMEGTEEGDEDTDDDALSPGEAAGLVVPARQTEMTLMVTEDLDGKLVFSNNLKDGQGALDAAFTIGPSETQNATTSGVDSSEGGNETEDEDDGETMDEDMFMDSDDGGTTDDDMMVIHGFVTPRGVPFRFPTPPLSAINPLSTVSPQVRSQARRSRPPPPTPLASSALPYESPNPSDILAGRRSIWDGNSNHGFIMMEAPESQPTSPVAEPPTTPRQPIMGTFFPHLNSATPQAVIGDNTMTIPSPFPRNRIRRKSVSVRGHRRSGSKNEIFPHLPRRRRQLSLPGGSRAPAYLDDDTQSSPELPPPIQLDDVLEASFLEDSNPMTASITSTVSEPYETRRHMKSLARWDRIPMGTFRRPRTAGGLVDDPYGGSASAIVLGPSNDGFSYGATSGSILRKSSFPSSPFETLPHENHEQAHPRRSKRHSGRRSSMSSRTTSASLAANISPVIFPVRDPSERTPTRGDTAAESMRYDSSEHTLSGSAAPAGQKLRKYKRKKRKRAAQHAATVHHVQQQIHLPHPSSHHIHHARYRPAASSSRHVTLSANVPPLRL